MLKRRRPECSPPPSLQRAQLAHLEPAQRANLPAYPCVRILVSGPRASLAGAVARNPIRDRSAPIAQLDRASGYEPGGRKFESCWAHQSFQKLAVACVVDHMAR